MGVKLLIKRMLVFLLGYVIPFKKIIQTALKDDTTIEILHQRANEKSADFVEKFCRDALIFRKTTDLWDYGIKKIKVEGLFLEFGVHSGKSINYFADRYSGPIYGFDSFVGLKQDWPGTHLSEGAFDLSGNPPEVKKNVVLVKGWFEETLQLFFSQTRGNIAFIHIDSDTYESAKFILDQSKNRFLKGTLILFDDFFGYPGFENGEFKAWAEFAAESEFKYIGFSNQQALIEYL
jgi:hypothetical protein